MAETWSVEIVIDGKRVLLISEDFLSGVDNIMEYADDIRHIAKSIMGFVGKESRDEDFID